MTSRFFAVFSPPLKFVCKVFYLYSPAIITHLFCVVKSFFCTDFNTFQVKNVLKQCQIVVNKIKMSICCAFL